MALERKLGGSQWEGNTYASPETIRVRYEPKSGVMRTATGASVAVESYVLTETAVSLEDKIEGSLVKRVETVVNKGGKVLGYKAFL